jgi:ATP-binding cassette subfamily F protein 3
VDASWDLQTGQRIGLVGNNGAGKTTQLKVLAGELVLDAGEIIKSRPDIKIAMLRQEFREDLRDNRSLRDEFLSVFSEVEQLKQQYAEAEAKLSAPDVEPDAMQVGAMAGLWARDSPALLPASAGLLVLARP